MIGVSALSTLAMILYRRQGLEAGGQRPPLLPWFAVGFLLLAISALGIKTQLKSLASVGVKPIALMVGESVFLVLLVLALMHWGLA
ncbi:hypothetical protein V520_21810 [Pseudomonas putida KG-4]|nr:hypothetical protein V520_21810 [Pseudomonas putida KG-4]